jgi:hypothetical protein
MEEFIFVPVGTFAYDSKFKGDKIQKTFQENMLLFIWERVRRNI